MQKTKTIIEYTKKIVTKNETKTLSTLERGIYLKKICGREN